MKKIVLAYSGGLDTSIILRWLQENYKAEVIAYTSDIGQEIDKKKILRNAKLLGVKKVIIEDLKNIFVKDYVFPMIRAHAAWLSHLGGVAKAGALAEDLTALLPERAMDDPTWICMAVSSSTSSVRFSALGREGGRGCREGPREGGRGLGWELGAWLGWALLRFT